MAGVKGMKFKKERSKPEEIDDGRICDYGCERPAKFLFSNGKVCCRQHGGNCPSKRDKAIEKFKKSVYDVNPITGLTKSKEMALKAAESLRNQIDSETGISLGTLVRRKITENSIKSGNRQRGIEKRVRCGYETIDTATGYNLHRLSAIKGRETRLNDIDEYGFNSYERMWNNYHNYTKKHESSGLYYHSKDEKRFLDSLESKEILKVKRGPAIRYIDPDENVERVYFPDFIIGNNIYEIKSKYSWREWMGKPQLKKNVAKLDACIEAGYETYLIVDSKKYKWPSNPDKI